MKACKGFLFPSVSSFFSVSQILENGEEVKAWERYYKTRAVMIRKD